MKNRLNNTHIEPRLWSYTKLMKMKITIKYREILQKKRINMMCIHVGFFLFLAMWLTNVDVSAQDAPEIIPPSPESAQIHRFDAYPVNHFTGLVDISIPIYTINVNGMTVPIQLKYHASGIKVEDESGSVGLGWSLIAGGRISRTIRGAADEYGLFEAPKADDLSSMHADVTSSVDLINNWNYFDLLEITKARDAQNDIYSFSTPSTSGNFMLKYLGQGKFECITMPFEPIKFDYQFSTNPPEFDNLMVTDPTGYQYLFGDHEKQTGTNFNWTTSWLLTKILTPNAIDSITFTYQSRSQGSRRTMPNDHVIINDMFKGDTGGTGDYAEVKEWRYLDYDSKMLESISFKSGKIEFIADTDKRKIKTIKIYQKSDETLSLIKEITLNYNEFGVSQHYTMNEVVFKDRQLNEAYKYQLDYNNENTAFPRATDTRAIDFWGYYNGYSNTYLFPPTPIEVVYGLGIYHSYTENFNSHGNRNANDNTKHSVLTDMYLPTGGRIHYNYEGNYNEISERVGGLRIESQELYENGILQYISRYKYGQSESGNGEVLIEPLPEYYISRQVYSELKVDYSDPITGSDYPDHININRRTILGSNPNFSFWYSQKPHVVYPDVTEYRESPSGVVLGKTNYKFSYNEEGLSTYDIIIPMYSNPFFNYYEHEKRFLGKDGKLLEQHYSRRNTDNSFTKVKSKLYDYRDYKADTVRNLYTKKYGIWNDEQEEDKFFVLYWGYEEADYNWQGYAQEYGGYISYPFDFGDQYIYTGTSKLSKITEQEYDDVGQISLVSNTNYYYENTEHMLPTKIKVLQSDGDSILSYNYYPQDYNSIENFSTLISNNIVSIPIKTEKVIDGQLLNGSITKYTNEGKPSEIFNYESEILKTVPIHDPNTLLNLDYIRKITYDYDNETKNVNTITIENNPSSSYLWSLNDTYPVIKADNIDNASLQTAVHAAVASLAGSYTDLEALMLALVRKMHGDVGNLRSVWDDFNTTLRSNVSLSEAMITTITYDPLIGMTSQTDPAGITTYYAYDNFGRLESIKDKNGDIVKAYDYHYMAAVEPPELSVTTTNLKFSDGTASKNVNVASNVSWTASDNASWISVSPTTSSGDGSISITTTSNTTLFSRTGTVTVRENDGSGVASQQISISQNGATPILNASPTSLAYTDDGGSKTINITSNLSWAVTDNQSWLSVSPTSGSGNGSVSITALPNGSSSRAGTITIDETAGTAVPAKQIPITQQAGTSTLDISPTSLQFPGTTTKSFHINSDVSWSISIHYYHSSGWLSVSQSSGNGNATISVTSSNANTRGALWEAEIQVTGGGIYRVIDCTKFY